MDRLHVGILFSGEGTTAKTICDAANCNILNINITCLFTNQEEKNNQDFGNYIVRSLSKSSFSSDLSREEILQNLIEYINSVDPEIDVLIFAGWNLIVDSNFINSFKRIINLHPSLPNSFVGSNCIEKAFNAFQRGEIKYTGSMVHEVIEEIDRGKVLSQIVVPIYNNDTLESLTQRQKDMEKGILIQTIQNLVTEHNLNYLETQEKENKVYVGKVRRVEDIGYGCLLMSASNRLSSFDRYICDINNKGNILNNISAWWFSNTYHIIDNHYLYHQGCDMIVKKTNPIKLEIIVRGYMTGSTNTSIWTMYKNGERNIYGLNFREGYLKNQILDSIILTPTTKGVTDVPITPHEIVQQEYLTQEEWEFVSEKALELFRYGQMVADSKGLILVDTKYEFGRLNNNIILIDEVHTCDSSRYWVKETYNNRFNNSQEPEKLDKDAVRDWIKSSCDPYKSDIPNIPNYVIEKVESVYNRYNNLLTDGLTNTNNLNLESYFTNIHRNIVVILAGSTSDREHVEKIKSYLREYQIYSNNYYSSAHKNTREVLDILDKYEFQNRNIVYVTVAGRSNALSGVTACNTRFPVIACPPFKDKVDFQVNINSTLMCPSKVPVMTILEPENVALSIRKIFDLL